MESILQFMYLGEARFYHERMKEFLKVAQDLEVKEISGGSEPPSNETEETVVDENTPEEMLEDILKADSPAELKPVRPRRSVKMDASNESEEDCNAKKKLKLNYSHVHEEFVITERMNPRIDKFEMACKCLTCGQIISGKNSTNLKKHLEKKHREKFLRVISLDEASREKAQETRKPLEGIMCF